MDSPLRQEVERKLMKYSVNILGGASQDELDFETAQVEAKKAFTQGRRVSVTAEDKNCRMWNHVLPDAGPVVTREVKPTLYRRHPRYSNRLIQVED